MNKGFKRAFGTSKSSSNWLKRQAADPFVKRRELSKYRARSAFKLLEIDDKYGLLKPNSVVLDLGAAPGSWSQVAFERTQGLVIMNDLLDIKYLEGPKFIKGDYLDEKVQQRIMQLAGGERAVDTVLSDMAPNTMGQQSADHDLQMELVYQAFEMAKKMLKPDGDFLVKVFFGQHEPQFAKDMKQTFKQFKRIKPGASRGESREMFFLGRGLK